MAPRVDLMGTVALLFPPGSTPVLVCAVPLGCMLEATSITRLIHGAAAAAGGVCAKAYCNANRTHTLNTVAEVIFLLFWYVKVLYGHGSDKDSVYDVIALLRSLSTSELSHVLCEKIHTKGKTNTYDATY